jgi:hypothetical protein
MKAGRANPVPETPYDIDRRRSMKLKLLGASAMALGLAFGLMGAPAASASGGNQLVVNEAGNVMCVPSAPPHNTQVNMIEYQSSCATVTYFNEYTTPNGNAWYEIKLGNGLCLNWDPSGWGVYADSCIAGDPNELFYTHVSGQLINLAGNEDTGEDTWLQPEWDVFEYTLVAIPGDPFTGWQYSG